MLRATWVFDPSNGRARFKCKQILPSIALLLVEEGYRSSQRDRSRQNPRVSDPKRIAAPIMVFPLALEASSLEAGTGSVIVIGLLAATVELLLGIAIGWWLRGGKLATVEIQTISAAESAETMQCAENALSNLPQPGRARAGRRGSPFLESFRHWQPA